MQYVRARYLDVQAGRWVSRDPIGYDGGDWNLFRYVGNEVIGRVDPSGLKPNCVKPNVIFWIGDNPFYYQIFSAIVEAVTKINNKGKYFASITGRSHQALHNANIAPNLAGLYTSAHGGCGGAFFGCEWCYIIPLYGRAYNVWSTKKRPKACQHMWQADKNNWKILDPSSFPVFKQLSQNHCINVRTSKDIPAIESWLASRLGVSSNKVKLAHQSQDYACESNFQDHYDALKRFESLFI